MHLCSTGDPAGDVTRFGAVVTRLDIVKYKIVSFLAMSLLSKRVIGIYMSWGGWNLPESNSTQQLSKLYNLNRCTSKKCYHGSSDICNAEIGSNTL